MFAQAVAFNGDISTWDVSAATTFESMFYGAESFNGDITTWDTSSATTFYAMFMLAEVSPTALHRTA